MWDKKVSVKEIIIEGRKNLEVGKGCQRLWAGRRTVQF